MHKKDRRGVYNIISRLNFKYLYDYKNTTKLFNKSRYKIKASPLVITGWVTIRIHYYKSENK